MKHSRKYPIWRQRSYWLAVVLGTLAAVLFAPAPADAQTPPWPVVDDGRYGPVPHPPTAHSVGSYLDDQNDITISYTRLVPQDSTTGGGSSVNFVYGACTLTKRATQRKATNGNYHLMYGDVYAYCPPDSTGEPGLVLPTCTWVGNFRGQSWNSTLDFLGYAGGEAWAHGTESFRWAVAGTSDAGQEPQNGIYESQGVCEIYTAPRVLFGKYFNCGVTPAACPAGASPGQSLYQGGDGHTLTGTGATIHYETLSHRPTPPLDPQQRNFARVTIYDLTAFWSSTPVNWCQEPCTAPNDPPNTPSPEPNPDPPDDPNAPRPEFHDANPPVGGGATASGSRPPDTMIRTARQRAENFWGGQGAGKLTACMDNDTRIVFVGRNETIRIKADNGATAKTSMNALSPSAPKGATGLASGCNAWSYHSSNRGGNITDPRIFVNKDYQWSVETLCVNLAHEFGHQSDRTSPRAPYGYLHNDRGGYEIMRVNPYAAVMPWPPCPNTN